MTYLLAAETALPNFADLQGWWVKPLDSFTLGNWVKPG